MIYLPETFVSVLLLAHNFRDLGDKMKEKFHIEYGETAITVICDGTFFKTFQKGVVEAYSIVENNILSDPVFGKTFDPYVPSENCHALIKRMCSASVKANVGPMAAVAGAISEYVSEYVTERGCDDFIIDNGGDIAIRSDRSVTVGMYGGKIADGTVMDIPPHDGIYGVCSSSGKVGHSFSEGIANIATVFSRSPILADACATRLGNIVKSENDLKSAVEDICSVNGVDGCIAMCGESVALGGDVPNMRRCTETCRNITCGLFLI